MRKVKEVLAELAETTKRAETVLEEVPYKVRAGFAAAVEEAKTRLPALRSELLALTVPSRLAGVFAEGDSEAVVKTATFLRSSAAGGIVLDAEKLYREFVDVIEPSFGSDRIFRVTQYGLLMSEYSNKVADLFGPAVGRHRPEYIEETCRGYEETLTHVRRVVRDGVGDELNLRALQVAVLDEVLAGDMDARRIPVLVLGATDDEKPGLAQLFTKSTTHQFEAGFEPTKDSVLSIFKGSH